MDAPARAANLDVRPSAVAWSAIIAGAIAAIATDIVLLSLGAGLGLTAISPWNGEGVSAKAFTVSAAIWTIIVQWFSAALGGYLTGRLRVRWTSLHVNEVYFRDSAHGFLSWALSVVVIAVITTSMAFGTLGTAARGVMSIAGANTVSGQGDGANVVGYFVDSLYRSDNVPNASSDDVRGETARILTRSLSDGDANASDRAYLARLVAARTGVSQDESQKRVDAVIVEAKQVAEIARKAAARAAIATALALAIGAFIAAVAALMGGRERNI